MQKTGRKPRLVKLSRLNRLVYPGRSSLKSIIYGYLALYLTIFTTPSFLPNKSLHPNRGRSSRSRSQMRVTLVCVLMCLALLSGSHVASEPVDADRSVLFRALPSPNAIFLNHLQLPHRCIDLPFSLNFLFKSPMLS